MKHVLQANHPPGGTRRLLTRMAVMTLTTCLAAVSLAGPAVAEGQEELTATQTVSLVDAVDPTAVAVADIVPTGGELVARENGTTVEVPRDPAAGIALTAADGAAITIGLPGAAQARDAKAVGDTIVYEQAAPSTDIAVQATTSGGVRQLITIAGADAPSSYSFTVDVPEGAQVVHGSGGGVEVVKDGQVLTAVDAPWARDRNGNDLPTHYTVDGNTVTQHITFNDATSFPVAADPLWLPGWVIYMVGSRCGLSAAAAITMYRLSTERRSVTGYASHAAVACFFGGLGIRRW